MILLDPQDSDAPSKLDLPPLGPTLRFPEPAVGSASITGSGGRTIRQRPSLSSVNSTSTSLLLPDYDSSQAEHAQGVVSSLSLRPQWKRARRRFWNSVFWALGIYGACSLVFGIPYLSYKLIHEEHSKGTRHFPSHSPPPLSPLPYPGSTNSTGEDRSVVNDSACNDWGSSSMKDLLTRSMNRTLRGTNTFTFMANISPHSNSTSPLTGSLIIDLNPDAEAAFPEFLSSIRASSIDLDDAIRLCVEQQGTSATIAFYLPDNLGSRDHLTINLTLLLPQSSTFVPKDLVTYLPQFTQTFGNFSSIKPFNKVSVDGAFAKVYAMSLHGKHISVKTSLAEISGNYDSSDSLSLDTIGAPITANITMRNPNNRKKRSFLSIDNGNGDVLAHVILIAPTPPTTLFTRSLGLLSPPRSPPFFISAKTFNSPLTLDIVHHFSTPPSNLHVDAHNNMGACTVTLDDKYQGTYEVQAKLATASVEDEVASEDPNPLFGGAKRQHSRDYQAANWKSGWVGWKRPSSNQGHVQVDSSMAPSMLRWH